MTQALEIFGINAIAAYMLRLSYFLKSRTSFTCRASTAHREICVFISRNTSAGHRPRMLRSSMRWGIRCSWLAVLWILYRKKMTIRI